MNMRTHLYIQPSNALIGKTYSAINIEFDIKVISFYDYRISNQTKQLPSRDSVVKIGQYITFEGNSENIDRLKSAMYKSEPNQVYTNKEEK